MGPEAPAPPPVEAPLGASQRVAALLASAPPFGKVEVSGVSLSYVRVRNGEVLERWSLRGLAAAVEAKHQEDGWRIFATTGQTGAPLPLELSREGSAIPFALAQLELALSAEAGASAARVRVDLDVARQTFDPRLSVRTLLHGAVSAKFDGEKRHIAIELERTQLTDSAEVQAQGVLPDAADVPPVVTRAVAELDLGRLLQWVPADLRPFSIERGKVHLDAKRSRSAPCRSWEPKASSGWTSTSPRSSSFKRVLRVALGGGRISLVATPDPQKGLAARNSHSHSRGSRSGGPTRFVFRRPTAN